MDVDWDKYERNFLYRLQVSLNYHKKQGLKGRVLRAFGYAIGRSLVLLLAMILSLYVLDANPDTYGLALVGLGASILAWTAFRVHERTFRDVALVPEGSARDDTEYQVTVSMVSLNYMDALMGFVLVVVGFTVRVWAHLQ